MESGNNGSPWADFAGKVWDKVVGHPIAFIAAFFAARNPDQATRMAGRAAAGFGAVWWRVASAFLTHVGGLWNRRAEIEERTNRTIRSWVLLLVAACVFGWASTITDIRWVSSPLFAIARVIGFVACFYGARAILKPAVHLQALTLWGLKSLAVVDVPFSAIATYLLTPLAQDGAVAHQEDGKWRVVDAKKVQSFVENLTLSVATVMFSACLFVILAPGLFTLGALAAIFIGAIIINMVARIKLWEVDVGARVLMGIVMVIEVAIIVGLIVVSLMPQTYAAMAAGNTKFDERVATFITEGTFKGIRFILTGEYNPYESLKANPFDADVTIARWQAVSAFLFLVKMGTWVLFGLYHAVRAPKKRTEEATPSTTSPAGTVTTATAVVSAPSTAATATTSERRKWAIPILAMTQIVLIVFGILAARGSFSNKAGSDPSPATTVAAVAPPPAPPSTGTAAAPAGTPSTRTAANKSTRAGTGMQQPAKGGTPVSDSVDAEW